MQLTSQAKEAGLPEALLFADDRPENIYASPMLDADTDQAHGTICQWLDDYPNSKRWVWG